MSFRGLTSALLLITVIGMALGVMAKGYIPDTMLKPPGNNQVPNEGSSPIISSSETGNNDEQSTPAAESIVSGTEHPPSDEGSIIDEDPAVQADLEQREASLTAWEVELGKKEKELVELERFLQARGARLDKLAESQQVTQDYITEQLTALQQERDRLALERESQRTERTYLEDAWAQLREAQALLQAQEADVAKREYEAHNLWLFSIVFLSLSGMVILVSIALLVVSTRRWRRTPGERMEIPLTLGGNGNDRVKKEEPHFPGKIQFKRPVL